MGRFAVASHAKAFAAQNAGHFEAEIVPILVRSITPATETTPSTTAQVLIAKDDGIRPTASIAGMAKLKPAFKENGTGTAGNSSQISDGASAMTLTRRDVAERLGLKPIARWIGSAIVGVPPRIMGVGPAHAVPALFKRFGLTKDDVDIFELNEGALLISSDFVDADLWVASFRFSVADGDQGARSRYRQGQSKRRSHRSRVRISPLSCISPLTLRILRHPLGATGGRLVSSLITELHRTGKQVGVATLCMGTGAGKATLIGQSPLCLPAAIDRLGYVSAVAE